MHLAPKSAENAHQYNCDACCENRLDLEKRVVSLLKLPHQEEKEDPRAIQKEIERSAENLEVLPQNSGSGGIVGSTK